jgi:hypothetical protein
MLPAAATDAATSTMNTANAAVAANAKAMLPLLLPTLVLPPTPKQMLPRTLPMLLLQPRTLPMLLLLPCQARGLPVYIHDTPRPATPPNSPTWTCHYATDRETPIVSQSAFWARPEARTTQFDYYRKGNGHQSYL